jgi:hypothetical protein
MIHAQRLLSCNTPHHLLLLWRTLLLLLLLQDADLSRLTGINMQILIPGMFLGALVVMVQAFI